MDEIQKVLVNAGRKDLAQKYYEKVSSLQSSVIDTEDIMDFAFDIFTGVVEIGLGGEWWGGKVQLGNNVFHHRKEKADPAYSPVSCYVKKSGDSIEFRISGGFLDKTKKVEISAKIK